MVVSQVTLWRTHPDAGSTGDSTRVRKGFTGSSHPSSGPQPNTMGILIVAGFGPSRARRSITGGGPLWDVTHIADFCRTRRCSGLFPKTDTKSSSPISDKRPAVFGLSRGPRHGGLPPSIHEASHPSSPQPPHTSEARRSGVPADTRGDFLSARGSQLLPGLFNKRDPSQCVCSF